MEEYDTGYDSSLLLCQVTMGSDSKRKSVSDPVGGQESTSESESKEDNKEVEGENKNSTNNATSNKQTPIKTHTCDYPGCKAKFDRPWKLSAHRCTHTGERPYKCKVLGCDKSYTNLTHLRRHEQQTHVEKPKVPSGEAAVKSLFVCDLPGCGLLFQKKSSLKRHRLNKHEPKADGTGFKCPYCSLVFTNNNNLKSHMYTHDGILPFKCELCNHSFRKHSDITRHLRKHRVYKCSYQDCPAGPDKIFESHHELRTHLAFSHPSKYSCDSCNKVFRLKCRLTSHRLSCASNADKVYNCIMSDCNHTFKLYRNMLQHVKHKHGGPRYTCNIDNCTKSFIWKISHTKHVQKCHKAYLGIEETDEDSMTEKKIKRPRRRRKDAGKPRQSAAELFSGLSVNKYVHEQLLTKEDVDNHEELMGKVISFIDEAAEGVLGGDAKNADSREDDDDDDIDDGEEEEEEDEEEEEEEEDEDSDMKDDFQADKDCDNSDNSNSCSVGVVDDNKTDNSSPPVASTPAIT